VDTSASARDDFATRLYATLAGTHAGKNLFLSPFSIQLALAMCAAGARGETRRALAGLLGAPENVDEQNHQYAVLLKSIQGTAEGPFQLFTANALWGQSGRHFSPDYRKAVADFYGADFREADFSARPDEAVKAINGWVREKTREKISELIQRSFIGDDTRLVLANAIYFKAEWAMAFQRYRTTDEDWHGPHGKRRVPLIQRTGDHHYHEGDEFQALELLYRGGRQGMLVLLPRAKDGLASLEARCAAEGIYRQVTAGLSREEVVVSLPRFKMEAALDLKKALCGLGAALAFSDDADFGGIGQDLKLSAAVHKAAVEVNEEGTEAAAATAVGMLFKGISMGPKPRPRVFRADHPFLFFIRDRVTNAVLFSGRLLDPT
jgi:serpin B